VSTTRAERSRIAVVSTYPAWEGVARVSTPGKAFSIESGEATPSYVENCLFWIAYETARSGQVLMSEAVMRRARFVSAQVPQLGQQLAALEREVAAMNARSIALAQSPSPPAVQRRAIRVRFAHTLMRWAPFPPQFAGAGDRPAAIFMSVPASWQHDGFRLVPAALTHLFSNVNAALCAREPADANYISPTSLTGIDVLDSAALLQTEWEKDVQAPVGIGQVTFIVGATVTPIAPADFIRLTYACLADELRAHAPQLALVLVKRFGYSVASAGALLGAAQENIGEILARV
jgi:hypothetical protein